MQTIVQPYAFSFAIFQRQKRTVDWISTNLLTPEGCTAWLINWCPENRTRMPECESGVLTSTHLCAVLDSLQTLEEFHLHLTINPNTRYAIILCWLVKVFDLRFVRVVENRLAFDCQTFQFLLFNFFVATIYRLLFKTVWRKKTTRHFGFGRVFSSV